MGYDSHAQDAGLNLRPVLAGIGTLFCAIGIAGPPLVPPAIALCAIAMVLAFFAIDRIAAPMWKGAAVIASLCAAAFALHGSFAIWRACAALLLAWSVCARSPGARSGDLPLATGAILGALLFFFA